jgi:hypothetical protein
MEPTGLNGEDRAGSRKPKGHFKLQKTSRERKFALFMQLLKPEPDHRALDIGGADGSYLASLYPWPERVTVLDLSMFLVRRVRGANAVCADALTLPFPDGAFDLVWSNAVIEHVGDLDRQRRFAEEIRRVTDRYFVTTPWRGFPMELHYRLPMYQFVPKGIQRFISKRFAVGYYPKGQWEDINLLWRRQMVSLFPDARVIMQRVTVWPETLIAYKA